MKWLWIVSLANLVGTGLLLLMFFAILLALGAFAASVTTWPLFALLPISLTLSIVGLRLARKTKPIAARRIGYVLNGCAFAITSAVVILICTSFLSATREKYIIPAGYKGEIYIVHGVADGKPVEREFWGRIYRIPGDGVLLTQAPMVHGPTRSTYYYQYPSGSLESIRFEWYSTIDRTPENLANSRDIGMYFPRSGSFTDAEGCHIEYDEIYIGTKADILSNPKELDFSSYLRNHPTACAASTK